jgi:hypothetical protein
MQQQNKRRIDNRTRTIYQYLEKYTDTSSCNKNISLYKWMNQADYSILQN